MADMTAESIFEPVPYIQSDQIFALSNLAKEAPEPKADLIIGAYRDAEGRPYPLKVVKKAESLILDMDLDKEYLPITGYGPFIEEGVKMVFGDSVPRSHVVAVQGLSGTGSLSIGAHFLAALLPSDALVYVSDPTWPNHPAVMQIAGIVNIQKYRYYDSKNYKLNFSGFLEDLNAAPERSVFILHACAHNPTGVDPTHEEWKEILDVFKRRRLIAFFDCAYQGYASGSLDDDAYAVRLFAKHGMELLLALSFSKNMGLYSERAGLFSVVMANSQKANAVKSQLELIARSSYSSPPAHGARIAHLIMSNPQLRAEWEEELRSMAERVKMMRQRVYNGLKNRSTPGTWNHIINQVGMFSYLGLSKEQCEKLCEMRMFVLPSGRANIAGLTERTADLLVDAIDKVVRST